MVRKNNSNTRLYIVLGILAFAIIVGTIMSSSFKERFTSEKTLVYFYMDNCPHCEKFEFVWRDIVEILKVESKYKDIKSQKINLSSAEANDYPEINSAPTIMLLPSKKIYDGPRTTGDILEWSL